MRRSRRTRGGRSTAAADGGRWRFTLDRGGTFTDCIAISPRGERSVVKLLSSDDAAVVAIRALLERAGAIPPGAPLPPCDVALGTTLATNALLERRGARTLLVANRGLGDVFVIGTQQRPDLFALRIEKPPPLHAETVEVAGRLAVDGSELEPLDEDELRAALASARRAGTRSVAIALIHSHTNPAPEERVAAAARALGFEHVVASSEIAREQGLLARGETAIADAYLTPLLRDFVRSQEDALGGSRLRFLQSSGGVTSGARFRGPAALLSGPAGGALGAARVAGRAGFARAIGFDMGGTSTDVCLAVDGEVERGFETELAGVRVRAPSLRVHSVAAGGGSICRFDGFRMTVGPESAGADPGPLCYDRRDASGAPVARDLTLTDANFALGRLPAERFPFPLRSAPVDQALDALVEHLVAEGHARSRDGAASGFVEIANAAMADAIRTISVARGVDPRECALVAFGGAAGQHACAVARVLGVRHVIVHPLASVLSAHGLTLAVPTWDGQRDVGRVALGAPGALELGAGVHEAFRALETEGRGALAAEGVAESAVQVRRWLDLRYAGADVALAVPEPAAGAWSEGFGRLHRERFGYTRSGRPVEATTARIQLAAPAPVDVAASPPATRAGEAAASARRHEAWFPGIGRVAAPLLDREGLVPGERIAGPALVVDGTSTLVIDPGFTARVLADGVLLVEDEAAPTAAPGAADLETPDPVRLEVLGNRFMAIAEQMGAVLRQTAVSANIKERLDYSCAVFDAAGGLVANAPHIPVHLGAMGETVRAVRAAFPDLEAGDAVVTNDPGAGGSHLPDVTVVTPVCVEGPAPRFFVASRGHHADIGGRTPGSMPADSRTLAEEGVCIPPLRIVRAGRFDEGALRAALGGGPHPARNPDDNVADVEAMFAANRAGERLLRELVSERSVGAVEATMRQLQAAAAGKVAREIARLASRRYAFADRLDDGTPVRVALEVEGARMRIDFTGTGAAVPGNLNAPRAVVQAAILYVLRCLVAERFPLNGGCLAAVEIVVPAGSLLDPPAGAAVVGGNVETSQRVVDVLLGALRLVAASQGTMNNVAFGDARFGYYETIGGGAGAGPDFHGASGVHVHMTNTRITDPEVLEWRYPVRLLAFRRRRGSGGSGRFRGGDGLVRAYGFLAPVTVSLLCERRTTAPFGLAGGGDGAPGAARIVRADGREEALAGHANALLAAGDALWIETPGGGGYGPCEREEERARRARTSDTSHCTPAGSALRSPAAWARSSIGRARDS